MCLIWFNYHHSLITFDIFIYLYISVNSFHLKRLEVPGPTENGSSVWLFCDYYLEKATLHSVKWYRNNVEFYRYTTVNEDKQRKKFFPQIGINVNINFSNASHVYLESIDLNTEGTYGCEVSTEELAGFKSIKAEKDLRLYVLPKQNLSLIGVKPFYRIGDVVDISCISGPSKPPAILAWFINDQQILDSEQNLNLSSMVRYVDYDGSSISLINISFQINRDNNFISSSLNLKCSSIMSQIIGYTFQEIAIEEKGLYLKLTNDYSSKYNGNNHLSPQIDNVSNHYKIGNQLNINCTSSKTYPSPFLEWYINNRKVTSKHIINYSQNNLFKSKSFTSTVYDYFANFDQRPMSTVLGLNFTIMKRHYQTLDSTLRIKCFSTHAKIIFRDDVGLSLLADGRTTSYLILKSNGQSNCIMAYVILFQQIVNFAMIWL